MKLYNQIAVAIPFSDFEALKENASKISEYKPDIIEIRFDYAILLKNYAPANPPVATGSKTDQSLKILFKNKIFSTSNMKELRDFLRIPVIFTLRRKDQGGMSNIQEDTRIEIIKYLIALRPDYIDLECDIERQILQELVSLAEQNGVNIIYSYHNWEETPPEEKVIEIFQNLIKKCPHVLLESDGNNDMKINGPHNHVLKLIFTAKKDSDNCVLLNVCRRYAELNYKVICFAMGDLGIPSRVGSLLEGGFLSFASIGETTAPGQINIQQFRDFLKKK